MAYALISDVHGNLPALRAVLKHAEKQGATTIWNLGDFVGYAPFPDECVQLLREQAEVNLLGNYDKKVLKVKKKREEWKLSKTPEKWQSFEWAYTHLSSKSLGYLKSLPVASRKIVDRWEIEMVHGSPASINEYLSPETPEERFIEISQNLQSRVILCGHSHIPFIRQVSQKWFINPGSVGRMDDGDPRASYATLSFSDSSLAISHYRVPYPVGEVVQTISDLKLPDNFSLMFIMGRNLDFVHNIKQISQREESIFLS
jgi:putative phosphoesterase